MNNMPSISKTDSLEKQVENLSRLVEINGIINSTLNINRLLSIIMEMIKDIMSAEASSLLLYDDVNMELVFKVALGEAGQELKEKYRVKLGQGIAGWVALHRKSLLVNDVYSDTGSIPCTTRVRGLPQDPYSARRSCLKASCWVLYRRSIPSKGESSTMMT